MCQVRPFHSSASVATVRDLVVVNPTVTQAEREVHDTLLRKLDAAPGGLGAAWVRHVVPADRSTRTAGDWLVLEYPTAVQARAVPVFGQGLRGARAIEVGPGGGARRR